MKLRHISEPATHIKLLYLYFLKGSVRALIAFQRMPNSRRFADKFGVWKSKFRKDYKRCIPYPGPTKGVIMPQGPARNLRGIIKGFDYDRYQ